MEIIKDVYIPDGNYASGATLINSINYALRTITIDSNPAPDPFGISWPYNSVPVNGLFFEYDSFSNRTINIRRTKYNT